MPLTRDFKETIQARLRQDAACRKALLAEAAEVILSGDTAVGKTLLRNYVNATLGFEGLASKTGIPAKSLMRMLSPKGNPRSDALFEIIASLQKQEGICLEVRPAARRIAAGG
mgnify:CR=1 FL=1